MVVVADSSRRTLPSRHSLDVLRLKVAQVRRVGALTTIRTYRRKRVAMRRNGVRHSDDAPTMTSTHSHKPVGTRRNVVRHAAHALMAKQATENCRFAVSGMLGRRSP